MANDDYVEAGEYSEDYVISDSSLPKVDLRRVYKYLDKIVSQNEQLIEDNIILKKKIISLENSIGDKISSKIDSIALISRNNLDLTFDMKKTITATNGIVSHLPSMDYIDTKIPFVDDQSIRIYPKGTRVIVKGVDTVCVVVSSHFVPHELHTYVVVYTVHLESNSLVFSNFASDDVSKFVEVSEEVS